MACCVAEDASKRALHAEKYPEFIEVVLGGNEPFPHIAALYGELGLKFAETCGKLGTELDVDPADLAEAYMDPKAFDVSGAELNLLGGVSLEKLPIVFKFQRQARKNHVMVGLPGAGKSTILRRLKLSADGDVTILTSSSGFQVETLWLDDFACIVAWDCPACEKDPLTWHTYLKDAVSVIFVVDSDAGESFEAASAELANLLNEEELAEAVLLVYANKQDAVQAVSAAHLTKSLGLKRLRRRRWFVQAGCASTGDGIFQGIGQLTAMLKLGKVGEDETEPDVDAGDDSGCDVGESEIAEVVLDCVHNDGSDFASMPARSRAVVFNVPREAKFQVQVGRQHQPGFFEGLLQRLERVLAISRSHFSLSWDASNEAMMLHQLSKNLISLDNARLVQHDEIAQVFDGTWIGFRDPREGDSPFLVFRLGLRSRREAREDGPFFPVTGSAEDSVATGPRDYVHMQTMQLQSQTHIAADFVETVALLRCVHASGTDVNSLSPESREIRLSLNVPLEIGRLCQVGFFERLLSSEPQWLSCISRKHCRVCLSAALFDRRQLSLNVENLSGNVVYVHRRPLAQHQSGRVAIESPLGFVTTVSGNTIQFLEFVLVRLDTTEISI